jgi:osmotically inducible protein OsmC
MQRKASAVWQGGLKDGKGTISTDSGVLKQTQYSFSTRFENGVGTNPEELLAAAHAGCFTMALSAQLGNVGMTASKLETTATITLDKLPDGFAITKSHLDLVARVPGADKSKFDAAVKAAETGCPVSKLFKAEISVTARLES